MARLLFRNVSVCEELNARPDKCKVPSGQILRLLIFCPFRYNFNLTAQGRFEWPAGAGIFSEHFHQEEKDEDTEEISHFEYEEVLTPAPGRLQLACAVASRLPRLTAETLRGRGAGRRQPGRTSGSDGLRDDRSRWPGEELSCWPRRRTSARRTDRRPSEKGRHPAPGTGWGRRPFPTNSLAKSLRMVYKNQPTP